MSLDPSTIKVGRTYRFKNSPDEKVDAVYTAENARGDKWRAVDHRHEGQFMRTATPLELFARHAIEELPE